MRYLLSILLLISSPSEKSPSFDDLILAFKEGNATAVSAFLEQNVDITFPDKTNTYSRNQARLVLEDFFAKIRVKDFYVLRMHSQASPTVCIGRLSTAKGNYRTTLICKRINSQTLLQELRFER